MMQFMVLYIGAKAYNLATLEMPVSSCQLKVSLLSGLVGACYPF
jgi:hypothetical protein